MLIARLHQGSADTTARKSASSQNPLQIARLLLEDPLEIPPFPLPPNDAPVTRRLDVHRIGSPLCVEAALFEDHLRNKA
jgi:hypothetical protein